MNLEQIRRVDAAVRSIVASASHVAVYQFDVARKMWVRPARGAASPQTKKNVEGSLFIVDRSVARPAVRATAPGPSCRAIAPTC